MDSILKDDEVVGGAQISEPSNEAPILTRSKTTISRFNEDFNDTLVDDRPDNRHSYPLRIIQGLRVERSRQKSYERRQNEARPKSPTFQQRLEQERMRRASTATALAYERRRSVARSIVEKHREAKLARREQEKVNKKIRKLSGTVWGYDPTAGRIANPMPRISGFQGTYVFRGLGNKSDQYGIDEVDVLGRRTGRQWLAGDKWGIEFRGPGRPPKFEPVDIKILRSETLDAVSCKGKQRGSD